MFKILLVEDNEINRDMLSRRLERKGYEIVVAINGAQAVDKARLEKPDLILMDLHLPVLDGWEATRQIKATPQTEAIPVIALTADALAGEREKAIAIGCDDYDTKPVDLPRLIAKMTRLLESARAPIPTPRPPELLHQPARNRLQRILRIRLRRQEFDPPIHSIVGYSDLLLDLLDRQQGLDVENLRSDIQKLLTSGIQLLQLTHAMLNPVLVEIQQQQIDLLVPALRWEMLTPLSTIIGYCEILLEEAPAAFVPDLERIYTSAQDLLSKVNGLDGLVKQQIELIEALSAEQQNAVEKVLEISTAKAFSPQAVLEDYPSPNAHANIEGNQVLVVDNDAYHCALLTRQLESQGAQVTVATTSQQALQALAQPLPGRIATTAYDLVLLEVNLPEVSGLEVLSQIRAHHDWQHIPVVIMAAFDEMDVVAEGIVMGAADYLSRPSSSIMLRHKVVCALERKRLQNQHEDLTQTIAALQNELEQVKQAQQATEIKQTDYFQHLQATAEGEGLRDSPARADLPIKVLLVEDNELNSDMLSRRLKRAGYEVVIAGDGAESVAKTLSEQPDIILMDISLPIMDGWEATQHLKADAQTRQIPVIALTAHAMAGDHEKALAAGCDDYDTKPIDLPRLLGKIEKCLECIASG